MTDTGIGFGDPVPRYRRNPRRGYDRKGREMRPVTVGWQRGEGATTVAVYCDACPHHAIISTDGLPDDFPVPDIGTLMRCSACGSRNVRVMMDMLTQYARAHEKRGGGGGPLPASYRVDAAPFAT